MTDIERVSTSNLLEQAYSDVLDKLMARFTNVVPLIRPLNSVL